MGDGVFGYPESKHGGEIKERPFADAKNLPYNPPHLIVQAFISFTSIPPACIFPTPILHTSVTFSTAPATYHSFTNPIWTISTAIPHTIPQSIPLAIPLTIPHTIPLAISRAIPHAILSTIPSTILSSIPNSLRISPNLVLNNFCTYVHPCLLSYFHYFLFSLIFTFRSGYICTFSHILILIPLRSS